MFSNITNIDDILLQLIVTYRPVNAVPFVQSGSNWACFIHRFDKFHHIPT